MKPLILTGDSGTQLMRSDLADLAIVFCFRFVWGALPAPDVLAAYLAARSDKHGPGAHWSDFGGLWRQGDKGRKDRGLVEFCQQYETVELWFDTRPNDQLQLIWLLDYFSSHPEMAARLRLRLVDYELIRANTEELGRWKMLAVPVTGDEFETASLAWQAYRAMTPEACFNLLRRDLNALPLFKPALLDLLEELPSASTGLGATEIRLLELIARVTRSPMGSSISRGFASVASSAKWKWALCSKGSPTVRHRLWRALTMSYARSAGIIIATATRPTSEAGSR